jgi:hypothetical protein
MVALFQYRYNLYVYPYSDGFRVFSQGKLTWDDKFFYLGLQDFVNNINNPRSYKFSYFAGVFLYPVSLIKSISLPDALIFNSFGHSFTAVYVYKTLYKMTRNYKNSFFAFLSTLFCGLLWIDGLTFMRDGWTATFFIMMIYYFLDNQMIFLLFSFLGICLIRLGSGAVALLALFPFVFSYIKEKSYFFQKKHRAKVLLFVLFLFILLMIFLPEYLRSKNFFIGDFARLSFIEYYQDNAASDNIFARFLVLPFFLRIPLTFIHYLMVPYFNFEYFAHGLDPSSLFPGFYSLWILFFIPFIIRNIYRGFKENNYDLKNITYSYIISIFILSQCSMQSRHKDFILPFIFLLAFYYPVNFKIDKYSIFSILYFSIGFVRFFI